MADIKETFNNTPDHTEEFDPADIAGNKLFAIFAYLGILVLIPILAAKDSKYARFHANQGIVLAIAEIVVSIAVSILSKIPLIGWLFSIVGSLVGLAALILLVIGILNVCNDKAKELPFIGSIQLLK